LRLVLFERFESLRKFAHLCVDMLDVLVELREVDGGGSRHVLDLGLLENGRGLIVKLPGRPLAQAHWLSLPVLLGSSRFLGLASHRLGLDLLNALVLVHIELVVKILDGLGVVLLAGVSSNFAGVASPLKSLAFVFFVVPFFFPFELLFPKVFLINSAVTLPVSLHFHHFLLGLDVVEVALDAVDGCFDLLEVLGGVSLASLELILLLSNLIGLVRDLLHLFKRLVLFDLFFFPGGEFFALSFFIGFLLLLSELLSDGLVLFVDDFSLAYFFLNYFFYLFALLLDLGVLRVNF